MSILYNYQVGDKVTLTLEIKRTATEPELYERGIIVEVGSWNTLEVLWNGFDHPITAKNDEVVLSESAPIQVDTPDSTLKADMSPQYKQISLLPEESTTGRNCSCCRFFAELKEPFERSDGAVIYGYCFQAGDKNYSPGMGKGFAVFIHDGCCKNFRLRKRDK